MATKDRRKLQHIHSSIADKQPTPQSLEVGEIAVNNSADKEFLSLKNSNDKVVRFSSDSTIINWIENKEVVPYKGYVRGEVGPSATSGDSPTSTDGHGSYGITNNDLLNNKSNIIVKINQVAAKKTVKYDKINAAKDLYNKDINPSENTPTGKTDGAGFFIDMSRYAMIGANPSFSSITVTDKSDLSGNTTIANGDGTGTRTGHTLAIKTTDVTANDTNWTETIANRTSTVTNETDKIATLNESATTRTTVVGTENLTVSGTTTEVHTSDVTITNSANVSSTTNGTTTEVKVGNVTENHSGTTIENKKGDVTENNLSNKTENTTGVLTENNSSNHIVNTTGATNITRTGVVTEDNKNNVARTTSGTTTETFKNQVTENNQSGYTVNTTGNVIVNTTGTTTETKTGNVTENHSGTTTENKAGNVTENNLANKQENTTGTHKVYTSGDTCVNSQANANFYGKVSTNIGVACDGTKGSETTVYGTTTTISGNTTNVTGATTLNLSGNTTNKRALTANTTATSAYTSATTATTVIGTANTSATTATLSGNSLSITETDTTINSCGKIEVTTDKYTLKQCSNTGGTAEFEFCNGYTVKSNAINLQQCGTAGTINITSQTQNVNGGSLNVNESGNTAINTTGTTNIKSTGNTNVETNGANNKVTIQASGNGGDVEVFAKDTLNETGATVNISGSTSANVSGATVNVSGGSICETAAATAAFVGATKTNIGANCSDGGNTSALNIRGVATNLSAGTLTENITGATAINRTGTTTEYNKGGYSAYTTGNTCIQSTGSMNLGGDVATNVGVNCNGAVTSDTVDIKASNTITETASTVTISGTNTVNVSGATINESGATHNENFTNYDVNAGNDYCLSAATRANFYGKATNIGIDCNGTTIATATTIEGTTVNVSGNTTNISGVTNLNISGATVNESGNTNNNKFVTINTSATTINNNVTNLNVTGTTKLSGDTTVGGKLYLKPDCTTITSNTVNAALCEILNRGAVTMTRDENPSNSGLSAVYKLYQNGSQIGFDIDVPKDGFLKNVELVESASTYYLHFVWNIFDADSKTYATGETYVNMENLVKDIDDRNPSDTGSAANHNVVVDVHYDETEKKMVVSAATTPNMHVGNMYVSGTTSAATVSGTNVNGGTISGTTVKGATVSGTSTSAGTFTSTGLTTLGNGAVTIDPNSACVTINKNVCVSGTITASQAIYSSDRNLKDNIKDVEYRMVDDAHNVRIKQFNFKSEPENLVVGVIAQEVEEHNLGDFVYVKEDGNRAVDYTSLMMLKIKYLENENEYLKAQMAEIRLRMENLENKINNQ